MQAQSLIFVSILWVACCFGATCVQDYECGNPPYTVCEGGLNECSTTISGLGVDVSTNQIYFAQVCRTDARFNNVTIKRVAATGGIPTVVQTRQQIPAPINPSFIFDVVGDLYLSIEARAPGKPLVTLDLETGVQSLPIDTGDFFQNAIEFDLATSQTFTCGLLFSNGTSNYTIDRFDGILGQSANDSDRQVLYAFPLGECRAVRKQANSADLYFAIQQYTPNTSNFTTILYQGSVDCVGCGVEPNEIISLDNERIQDFDITSDQIFYATETGVFSSNITGGDIQQISLSGASGVRILIDRVFWNSGSAIFSARFDGSDTQRVNQNAGTCGCRGAFTGASCNQCEGQVQWYEGQPNCVSLQEDGNPATCDYDYQCNDMPFSWCIGTCQCRPGLGGASCRSCTNSTQSIVWNDYGAPSCQ